MKTKKVLTWLFLPLVLDTLIACCGCDEPQLFMYTNSSLRLEHLDNRGTAPVVTTGTALRKAYGIRMNVHCQTTAFQQPAGSFFLHRAYAFRCDCGEPLQYHPKDSIIAMRIITLDGFDGHPANTDISTYFQLKIKHSFKSFSEYLLQSPTVFYTAEEKSLVLDAFLIPPVSPGTYRFRAELDLSDGRTLAQETSPVELQ